MAALIRNPHFKEYIEKIYIKAHAQAKGMSEQAARDKFKDSILDDYNMLSWILDSVFVNTKREGDMYKFITEPMTHNYISEAGNGKDYNGQKIINGEFPVGRMIFWVDDALKEHFAFPDEPRFHHGHIYPSDGRISCYGGYNNFEYEVTSAGISGALMSMYNFGRVSRHSTKFDGMQLVA